MKVLLNSFHLNGHTLKFLPRTKVKATLILDWIWEDNNRPQVSMGYRLINHRDVGRTRDEFVNHEPQASDLRILRVF